MSLPHLPTSANFHQDIIFAYSRGSSMASAFNAQSDPGVVFQVLFSFPTVNAEHIANRGVNINTVALGDCILQILFSSYQISLSLNQSFVAKIRSISISSPCHFYFVLYCFIGFSWSPLRYGRCKADIHWMFCTLVFALIRVRKHWWDNITQGKQ